MSRLPQLERALLDAAERLDRSEAAPTPDRGDDRRHARRWRRRSTPLLAGIASLLVAGAAIAAVSGLLGSGAPVPDRPKSAELAPVPATSALTLTDLRVRDPDGGPAWGIGTYAARATAIPKNVPAKLAAQFRQGEVCVVVGRVQAGQLGVIGRDGVFANDGRFHRLSPKAQNSGFCSGHAPDGGLYADAYGPPIPASGYTGPAGTAIGGCRERVNLDGPTVSPQTRRKLAHVPECPVSDLRQIVAGFAGPNAATATIIDNGDRKTITLNPKQNGAYLFVLRSAARTPPRVHFADSRGHPCLSRPPGQLGIHGRKGLAGCTPRTGK